MQKYIRNDLSNEFLKAEQTARTIIRKNKLLENTKSEDFVNGCSYNPNIKTWFLLKEYSMKEDIETTRKDSLSAVIQYLENSRVTGHTGIFLIRKQKGKSGILYSGEYAEPIFKSNLSHCSGKIVREPFEEDKEFQFQGVLTGSIHSLSNLANLLLSSSLSDYYMASINIPLPDDALKSRISKNEEMIKYLENYTSIYRHYGNQTRRVEERPVSTVIEAVNLLKNQTTYFSDHVSEGFVQSIIRFGAADPQDYIELKSLLTSIDYDSDPHSLGYEPVRCFDISLSTGKPLSIPCIGNLDPEYVTTLQPIKAAASLCLPPTVSSMGILIKDYGITASSINTFPFTGTDQASSGISIGKINGTDYDARISLRSLLSHSFICGGTDTGKSTTAKRVLVELYHKGIPFTVIEPAKKEYISLLGNIPEIRILTPGSDGMPLNINPLQPEDGILIESQVDNLVKAIVAATGGEHPIPEALNGLLRFTLHKFGWEYGTQAYTDDKKPFPTFKDVYKLIPHYIEKHGKYGPEVRQNLEGALRIRIENLYQGSLGRILSYNGYTAKQLLEVPTVIELSDLSSESVIFLMNILLTKIYSYLSRLPHKDELARVILIEEAHNLFARAENEESVQYSTNRMLNKILAEIRASGTGIMLSDQRPSLMDQSVIANTTVKIIHALSDEEDRSRIGSSLNMSDIQMAKIYELDTGEAIMGVRGEYGVRKVYVRSLPEITQTNPSCHICPARFTCKIKYVRYLLEDINSVKIKLHILNIARNPYNREVLIYNIDNMLQDMQLDQEADVIKICVLGEVLQKHANLSFQENRIIVRSYQKHLEKKNRGWHLNYQD